MARPGRLSRRAFGLLAAIATLVATVGTRARCLEDPADGARVSAPAADTLANGIPRDVARALEPWIAMWRASIPRLAPDSLRPEGRFTALPGRSVHTLRDFYPPDEELAATYAVFGVRDPSRRRLLVVDWYQRVYEHDGRVDVGGEPDSSPLLIDFRRAIANPFEVCGTACGYQWGCWVDSARFVLGGWNTDDDWKTYRGFLQIYSLADSSQARFVTPALTARAYQRCLFAWRSWVSARYQAWKSSRSKP